MLYLSQAIGRPVLDANGEPLGKVDDLIVAVGDRYPPVTGLVVVTDRRRIFLPWSQVARFDASGARLSGATIDITRFEQRPDEIGLRADLLDKQIVDIDGRKVVRVNDLRLDDVDGRLHLVAVDVGASGLLRRLGIEGAYRILARNLRLPTPERYIDWEDVDPVETSIASIRLRVPHAGLTELHPADLATIIDQLAPRDRAGVLAALTTRPWPTRSRRWSPRPRSRCSRVSTPNGRRTSSRRCRPTTPPTSSQTYPTARDRNCSG